MRWMCKIRLCITSCSIQCEARAWRILFIFLSFLCVSLIIALSMIVWYWKNQTPSNSSAQIKDLQHLCLECSDVSLHPIDDKVLPRNFETNGDNKTCCTKDSLHVKHLVHQFLERNHRISKARGGITIPKCADYAKEHKPAGRVVGVDHDQTGNVDEERYLLRWLNNNDGSFQTPGVRFTDGQLEIAESGYYWFNSRVTFRDTNTTFPRDPFAFFHTVFRRSAEYPLREDWKLVEAGKTRCKLRSGFTDLSSFVGDIAYFKKGERVIVKVSNPEMVSMSPYDSFIEVRLY